MSGSAIFRAGEAGMGVAEDSGSCLDYHVCKEEKDEDLSLKQLRDTETKLETT